MTTDNKFKQLYNATSIVIIILGALFLIWRAPYGYFFNDEPFCITIAQRLAMGDMLISDEWNACQNVGIILLPFYTLFHFFSESNDGILLIFRYIYCFFWFITCFHVFNVLKKQYYSAIIIFVYLILFAPLDYMTMSYTSISLMSCISICTLFYHHFSVSKINPYLFSVLFSIFSCFFVLCYPYLAAVYIIAFFCLIGFLVVKKIKHNNDSIYSYWKIVIIFSSVLIVTLAGLYLFFYVFNGVPIDNILSSLPFIFSSPEHNNVTSFSTVLYGIKRIITYSRLYTALIVGGILYWLVCQRFPHLKKYKVFVFAIVCIYYLRCQYNVCTKFDKIEYNTLNQQILGIVYLGIFAYILLNNKPKALFLCYIPLSLTYACIASISSNTGMLVISMALSVSGIASIVFISLLCKEVYLESNIKLKIISVVIFSVVMLMQVSSELYVRLTRFYWDEPMSKITLKIEEGAGKGIYTSKEYYDEYTETYEALVYLLTEFGNVNGKNFLSLKAMPVLYLDANLPYGIYSSWSFRMTPAWLNTYYSINPEKKADLIFSDLDNDVLFLDYFDINEYTVLEYNNYKLYVKNEY